MSGKHARPHPDQPELAFEIEYPAIMQPMGNGTVIVKPGKPILKKPDITVKQAARILHDCSVSTVHRYINEGLLTRPKQVKRKAKIKLSREEVEALATRIKGEEPESTSSTQSTLS